MNLKGKLAIAGQPIGSGGASSWDDLTGKPFSTVDTESGLTIQDDTLMIDTLDTIATIDYVDQQIESAQSDWDETDSSQLDYIKNKPPVKAGTGEGSIVFGNSGIASGQYAVTMGSCIAAGQSAHAEGIGTQALSQGAHTEGSNTIAAAGVIGKPQHVQGRFNIPDENQLYADIVGNGISNNRSNAEATDWDGNKYLAGDVYTHVTNWGTTPTLGAEKLATESYVDTAIGTIQDPDWDDITNKPTFATVATSGDYDDLSNKPTIPSIDGLATEQYVDDAIADIDIPTDVSELNNDAGYITNSALSGYATETYVDSAVDGITTTLETDYATKAELPTATSDLTNDSGFITASALEPYAESADLAAVATSGSYNDLSNKPTIPQPTSVTVTQGLTTGVTVGSIDVDGVTTTLYAPAGGGGSSTQANWAETDSTADSYIQNKPPIYQGNDANSIIAGVTTNLQANKGGIAFGYKTGTGSGQIWAGNQNERGGALAFGLANGYHSIKATGTGSLGFGKVGSTGDIQATGAGSLAFGDVSGSGASSLSAFGNGSICGGYGTDINSSVSGNGAIAFGGGTNANKNFSQAFGWKTTTDSTMQMAVGKLNVVDSASKYRLIVGNGSGSTRSNAFAAGNDGNIYVKGGIYINVTDWTNPENNSIKLANIPAPPTTDGTYTLQAVVSNGTITYNWI